MQTRSSVQQQQANDEPLHAAPNVSRPRRRPTWAFWWAVGGMLLGALIMGAVWMLAGRGDDTVASLLLSEVSRPAPDFALPGLNGDTVQLSAYRGKVVLVNFWATWCEPCKEETPELEAVYQRLRDQGFVIIGVNLRDKESPGPQGGAEIRTFVEQYGMSYPVALDTTGTATRAFQLSPIPTSYFVDHTGTICYVRIGKMTAGEVARLFEQARQQL